MPINTSISPPVCLHHPELRRGSSVSIQWEANTGYELDWAVTRESDEGRMTWQVLEAAETDWRSIEAGGTTWLTLEDRAEAQWQPLYRGPGELASEIVADCALEHIRHGAEIPADALSVRFRVRSYVGGQYSPYAVSEILYPDVTTAPEIGGVARLTLVARREYRVQVNLRDLADFMGSVIALTYPADKLELLGTTLDGDDFHTDLTEHTYESGIEEVSREPGAFRFRPAREIPADTDLTGLVACFRFIALADGGASVSLA